MKEDKYLAYLTGVYLSDGSCFKQNRGYVFKLSSIDMDYINYTNECLQNIIGKIGKVYTEQPRNFGKSLVNTIRVFEKDLFEKLTQETKDKLEIPNWIKECSNEMKLEFLSGLIDGDGWVVYNISGTSRGLTWQIGLSGKEELLKNVSRMCNVMNLKNWGPTKIKASKNTYRMYFDVLDIIKLKLNLKIKRKQERIDLIKRILNDYMLISKTKPERIKNVLDEDIV